MSCSGSVATRLCRPVRRCFRGLVDSVNEVEEVITAVACIGVAGPDWLDMARGVERRFRAIVVLKGLFTRRQRLRTAELAQDATKKRGGINDRRGKEGALTKLEIPQQTANVPSVAEGNRGQPARCLRVDG